MVGGRIRRYDSIVLNVVDRITGDGTFRALVARIRELSPPPQLAAQGGDGQTDESAQGAVSADGLWGSFAPTLAGAAARALDRPLLFVTAHLEQADEARDDIELFCGHTPELLSAFETVPGEGAASDEIHAERLALCSRMLDLETPELVPGRPTDRKPDPLLIVAPIQALMQAVPTPVTLEADMLTIGAGQQQTPQLLVDWLVDHGYARLDQVESPGDFALRGDILDIYPPGETDPYRVDFFDDKIESIRSFDVSTQRSNRSCQRIRVAGTVGLAGSGRRARSPKRPPDEATITSFLSYLPRDAIVAFAEPIEIQELGRIFWNRLGSPRQIMPVDRVFHRAGSFVQLHLYALGGGELPERFAFGVQSLARFETKATEALFELDRLARERDVLLYCDNEPERQRFVELWTSTLGDVPARLKTRNGLMHRGFDWPAGCLAVVGHHEVFHRYQQRRRIRKTHAARPIESWLDLQPGDYVVHVVHGIARFLGLRVMRKGDSNKSEEFLTLEFADAARMHVPVSQIDLVQKYIGAGAASPQLSKLGGTRWAKTKERVEEAVSDLAAELLRIQAVRASQPGISFPEDTPWQREFEGSFIYTETEDQLSAMTDIKRDMRKSMPMDRLLCGDVGYGKTELAIRAAFKAVEYGKQVAVLVPTTVLAEQHERTFRERFADYPFVIESLSRFKNRKQQLDTITRTRKGQVDILIGTHRLLSKDVGFKDLGLLVIDEEQRFGVEHKERLKSFRETVDVLTMSATPIPRTLHMSLLGIRDICSLETPPLDRRSIVTQVGHWDENLIRNAIMRELSRDGQVFFVHNLVYDIHVFADMVRQIVPEARTLIGHGQMHEHELERVMVDFIQHKADVLVCTTIIESGLDIPNCNTILIDQADRFGLSELHQLRGRVGRYKHRAYCYLMLSRGKTLTSTAARRLKAIEEFSDLGAGFRIAMRDLEIRGAGNILGSEQSGHIAAVGYELYCQLLDSAVRKLKDEPAEAFRPVHLELDVPAHIPRSYIDSERQRMEIYRRLVRCRTRAELDQLDKDIKDAFGPYPPTVQTLLDLAEIRILAQPLKIRSINQQPPDLIFTVDELALVEPVFAGSPGSPRMADAHTIHWRLSPAYFEPPTMLAILRRLLKEGAPATRMAVGI
ncbi:MAG: transcription-repair coupling factor [Phycisphaerae bacterium]|nr:transcription-repair coupling factor [Phycisphaerae bacterium]